MKVTKSILIYFLSVIFLGCEKEIDDRLDFNKVSLKQTQWKGTLQETDAWGDGEYTADIGMIFYTEDNGRCSVKRGDALPFQYDFEYSTNGKILSISEKRGDLDGHWLLIQYDKNKMVLEQGTGGDGAYKGVLTLTKVN